MTGSIPKFFGRLVWQVAVGERPDQPAKMLWQAKAAAVEAVYALATLQASQGRGRLPA